MSKSLQRRFEAWASDGAPTVSVREARRVQAAFRGADGFAHRAAPVLTAPDGNAKFGKDGSVATFGLAFAQWNLSTVWQVCPFATAACRAGCVSFAGKGGLQSVQDARATKTRFFGEHPAAAMALLADEIDRAAVKHGDALRVRLNTFSDIAWERLPIVTDRPTVRFYDYTKDWGRRSTSNYRLTFSASEKTTTTMIVDKVTRGENVAVVFDVKRGHPLPAVWEGMVVIDGDRSDDRWDDPRGVIVGLRAKGRMIGDVSGMVRDPDWSRSGVSAPRGYRATV